jgi:trans-aconitate methyltransferase
MKQTPPSDNYNVDLFKLLPPTVRRVVEVGSMHGAMARAVRQQYPSVHYTGIDIDPDYAAVSSAHCHRAFAGDVEKLDQAQWDSLFPSNCWIFGDCLEHLRDPWEILRKIRARIDNDGSVVTCIPNAQHWTVQARLATGLFRYEDSGLLDRTHIRWFTRITMLEMFAETGWRVEAGVSRAFPPLPPQEAHIDAIRRLAAAAGADPQQAAQDATVFQYVFRVVPH